MRHLSVIGLGAMGSTLATTLLKAGPLRAQGATLAPSVGAAIAATDITLVCVDNYAVSQQLPDAASDAESLLRLPLSGRSPERLYQRHQSDGRWRDEQEDDLPHLRLPGGVTPLRRQPAPACRFFQRRHAPPCTGLPGWQQ